MQVYVVTNVEAGWNCVCGVFVDINELKEFFEERLNVPNIDAEDGPYTSLDHIQTTDELQGFIQYTSYIIHEKWLNYE